MVKLNPGPDKEVLRLINIITNGLSVNSKYILEDFEKNGNKVTTVTGTKNVNIEGDSFKNGRRIQKKNSKIPCH